MKGFGFDTIGPAALTEEHVPRVPIPVEVNTERRSGVSPEVWSRFAQETKPGGGQGQ